MLRREELKSRCEELYIVPMVWMQLSTDTQGSLHCPKCSIALGKSAVFHIRTLSPLSLSLSPLLSLSLVHDTTKAIGAGTSLPVPALE
jgi:hypothetical protein